MRRLPSLQKIHWRAEMLKDSDSIPRNDADPATAPVDPPKSTGLGGTAAGILDAVADQLGGHWIRYGTTAHSCWFSMQELLVSEKEVFSRLSNAGVTLLTTGARNRFKAEIEDHTAY